MNSSKFMKKIVFFELINLLIWFLFIKKIVFPKKKEKFEYNNNFAIIQRNIRFSTRGLMAYYYINLGCALDYIHKGYIPIIDLISHKNIFNGFNTSKNQNNPWEIFFQQPFDLKLKDVLINAKNIKYVFCEKLTVGPFFNIFENKIVANYWHNIAKYYLPIKQEFIDEARIKSKYLFKRSNNVLGILIRGTDYIACQPHYHFIQPDPEVVYKDIILFYKFFGRCLEKNDKKL